MSESHPEVFISSTSIDLPEHREAVRDAILSLGFFPNGMEHWPVTGDYPVDLCKAMVEQAAIYLGIYAHRYGWRPDGYDGRSITELEYDWAGEVTRDGKPIPRLCFIMKDDHPWPKNQIEVEALPDLERFKARVKANQVGFFGSADDLKAQVTVALAKYQATRIHETPIRWEAGAGFDNYTLRHELGAGGNGQVWLADERLPDGTARPVAIKVLHAEIGADPVRVERFRREISSMARIDHPHIARVLTYGSRVDQLYVIMPYLPGGTLRARLTGRPLPEDQALRLLEQIGAALDYVHDRHSGLIHRDVKPENILVGEDGETLVLADFGLVFSGGGVDSLPDEGKPVGTGRYMAPEQWRREPLSRRTDLYALGILAYELLAGRLPYIEPDDDRLEAAHCTADLPAAPEIPAEVLRILQKATAKDPAERYPTARAFLTELRNWREDATNLEPRIRDYLNWVTDELYDGLRAQFVELAGDETAQRRYNIWDETDDLFARASATIYADHVRPEDDKGRAFVENVRERLLTLDRAVLVGEPGSGKSWMLQRLQADYARAWLKGAGRNLVPVRVLLNRYTGGAFADFVKAALDTLAPYHDRLLAEGRLVLLCDALNEMPRGADQMRQLVGYLKNAPYFVVSCRVRDYRGEELNDLKPLEQVLLRDLELPAIRELVHKRLPDDLGATLWTEMGGSEDLFGIWEQWDRREFWDARADVPWYKAGYELWKQMHSGARLIPLVRNPFMGDLLCRTYQEGKGRLPDSRAALFGRFIGQMLGREAQAAARRGEVYPDADEIQTALVALARAMQAAERTVLDEADALKAIARTDAAELVRAATDANILLAQDDGLKFAHQLLQEYFAARVLLEKLEADEAENSHQRARELFEPAWWDAGVWRETTIILGEFLGEGARGPNRVARWLGPVTPEVALEVITRNAGGLTQADVEEETREVLISGAKDQTTEPDPRGRAAAYRILGLFDADNRPGVGVFAREDGLRLPDIDWVEIPDGGEWTYQKGKHPGLPAFRIARYPVTYAQFQCFVDAPDYNDDRWWKDMPEEDKDVFDEVYRTRELSEQAFKYANHPRERVSWYQAVAFCLWLSDKLGYEVTLPTEEQWEKAARGTDGRKYPYEGAFDAAKGNTGETDIGQTSAVGIFPAGASPYGVLDMSGNVWEWCLNKYETPDDVDVDMSGARRVLRGGSWDNYPDNARAVDRFSSLPADRFSSDGFRICVSPSR